MKHMRVVLNAGRAWKLCYVHTHFHKINPTILDHKWNWRLKTQNTEYAIWNMKWITQQIISQPNDQLKMATKNRKHETFFIQLLPQFIIII